MIEWPKSNDALGTVNRGNACESGLCSLCRADCQGKCETWLSSLVGRKLLYPRDYGKTTAGADSACPSGAGYHALRIQGYAYGTKDLPAGVTSSADDAIFPNVNIETEFGNEIKTRCKVPIMTGALGSTFIAADYWDSFAAGAALCGIPIVVGENVVGVDKQSILENGRIRKAPELDRRINVFRKYYDKYGAIIIQMNVEDTKNGVAEYLMETYGNEIVLELKWGQGAKDIGGEIQVKDIEYAKFLKDRGYIVDPDPYDPTVQAAYASKAVKAFARHSRLGATDRQSADQVRESFMTSIAYLRKLGYKRISLKTGAYGLEALAMAVRFSADAGLDLLTIDGAGGGTGMSPWNMMQHWGVPSLTLHAKAREYCDILAKRGKKVPDLSFAGGFAREDHVVKAIALGSPYAKLVCMGRAPMIPGYLGSNIQGVFQPEKKAAVKGHWDELPAAVKAIGSTPEEIFSSWEAVKKIVGADGMKDIPWGAVAMHAYADKIACGVQQFMAGARKFKLQGLNRGDLMAVNRETAEIAGVSYVTEALEEQALKVLKA